MERNHILIVWMPSDQIGDERAYRDYVLESVRAGVLILPSEVTCEVMELPLLGGAAVLPAERAVNGGPCEPEKAPPPDGEEKRAVFRRLIDYRKGHPLGCLEAVARATRTKGRITDSTLRMLLTGDVQLPIEDWRKIGAALDRLEAKEAASV